MPYEHVLTDALSIRGMQALFDVAITRPMPHSARLLLFDRWCNNLQRRALAIDIGWLPATGIATTTANYPTRRVHQLLLHIVEDTPVMPPAEAGATGPRHRSRRPRPRPRAPDDGGSVTCLAPRRYAEWCPGEPPIC